MARPRWILLALALGAGAGCTAVLGMDAPRLDPCANGCGDAAGGAPLDARAPPTDAPLDRRPPIADVTIPCPTGAFCEDFEHDDKQGAWDTLLEDLAATFTVETALSVSPTRSSRVDLLQKSGSVSAQMSKALGTATSATLSFYIRFDALPGTSVPLEALLFGDPNAENAFVELVVSPSGAALAEDGTGPNAQRIEHPLTKQPALGAWQRFEITVRAAATPATVTVSVDGEVAFTGALQAAFAGGPLTVYHGIDGALDPAPWRYWVDDLVVTSS